MSRTESKTMQVHPDSERATIQFMQVFHWNLVNSQHVKNKSSHLERRGDDLYQVTETEHYVNLVFTRDLDTPGIQRIRDLEQEYNALTASKPAIPEKKGFAGPIITCLALTLLWGLGILIAIFWLPSISRKNKEIEEAMPGILAERERIERRQEAIIAECRRPLPAPQHEAVAALANGDDDVAFWDRIDKSDPDSLQEYLLRHPAGRFVELARAKLARLGIAPLNAGAPALEGPGGSQAAF